MILPITSPAGFITGCHCFMDCVCHTNALGISCSAHLSWSQTDWPLVADSLLVWSVVYLMDARRWHWAPGKAFAIEVGDFVQYSLLFVETAKNDFSFYTMCGVNVCCEQF